MRVGALAAPALHELHLATWMKEHLGGTVRRVTGTAAQLPGGLQALVSRPGRGARAVTPGARSIGGSARLVTVGTAQRRASMGLGERPRTARRSTEPPRGRSEHTHDGERARGQHATKPADVARWPRAVRLTAARETRLGSREPRQRCARFARLPGVQNILHTLATWTASSATHSAVHKRWSGRPARSAPYSTRRAGSARSSTTTRKA